jgi:hypothetical protein
MSLSGRLFEARAAGERALQASREEGDIENQLWTHTVLVQVAELAMADGGLALAHARSACELAEGAGGIFSQVLARAALGVAHLLREDWEPAIEAIECCSRPRTIMRSKRAIASGASTSRKRSGSSGVTVTSSSLIVRA